MNNPSSTINAHPHYFTLEISLSSGKFSLSVAKNKIVKIPPKKNGQKREWLRFEYIFFFISIDLLCFSFGVAKFCTLFFFFFSLFSIPAVKFIAKMSTYKILNESSLYYSPISRLNFFLRIILRIMKALRFDYQKYVLRFHRRLIHVIREPKMTRMSKFLILVRVCTMVTRT